MIFKPESIENQDLALGTGFFQVYHFLRNIQPFGYNLWG